MIRILTMMGAPAHFVRLIGITVLVLCANIVAEPYAAPRCVLLRFQERNLHDIKQVALRAAGLGEGAGSYMDVHHVRDISGISENDFLKVQAALEPLGGRVKLLGLLRDAAVACFDARAADKLMSDGSYASSWHVRAPKHPLVSASKGASEFTAFASAVAHALPHDIIAKLHFLKTLETVAGSAQTASRQLVNRHSSQLRRMKRLHHQTKQDSFIQQEKQNLAAARHGRSLRATTLHLQVGSIPATADAAAATAAPLLEPVSGFVSFDIPGPYPGTTYPQQLATLVGQRNSTSNIRVTAITFASDSPFNFLGLSKATYMMNHMDEFVLYQAIMLPCKVMAASTAAVKFVQYATISNAAACAGQLDVKYTTAYINNGSKQPSQIHKATIDMGSREVQVTSCGEAVADSAGKLAKDTCQKIQKLVAAATNAKNDIGQDTAIYIVKYAQAAKLPKFTALNVTVDLRLADSVAPEYRTITNLLTTTTLTKINSPQTPSELNQLYGNHPAYKGMGQGLLAAVTGAFGATNDFLYVYSPDDLAKASQAFEITTPDVTDVTNKPYAFANQPQGCYDPDLNDGCGEASLDIQMMTQYGAGSGVDWGFAATNWTEQQFGNTTNQQGYEALLGLNPLPDILSWSWGNVEEETAAAEATLAKFAALGITVIVSSGDNGPFADLDDQCETASIKASYPAASQWVTAVGAASFVRPSVSEPYPKLSVCSAATGGVITSGGGFGTAALGETPSWQKRFVDSYISSQQHLPTWPLSPQNLPKTQATAAVSCEEDKRSKIEKFLSKIFGRFFGNNESKPCQYGRGLPDVALIGDAVPVMVAGAPTVVYGTSVTAPVFAGLVAQINAAIRATPGLETAKIGYMNPFLYWAVEKYPGTFTDVVYGSSNSMVGHASECAYGYNAAKGWDAATGLGIPSVKVLQQAAIEYVKLQKRL